MAEESTELTAHVEVPATHEAGAAGHHGGGKAVSEVQGTMVVLTWITFGLLAAVLYKVAWKPILAGLEAREAAIRKSLDDAEKARNELVRIEQQRAGLIAAADDKAKAIVEQARQAAAAAAATIEQKARDEAQILLANAQREIRTERDRAMAALRSESAELAIGLARRVLRDQLDEARGRAVVNQTIEKA